MLLRSVALLLLVVCAECALSQSVLQSDLQSAHGVRQRFVCNSGYTQQSCDRQMTSLRRILDRYGAGELRDWTWVLVRSEDWKHLKLARGLNGDSPAFTELLLRETFIEEALVAPVPGRSAELIRSWSSSISDLLSLAVTHELGHALCAETDEQRADDYGKQLRAGIKVTCK